MTKIEIQTLYEVMFTDYPDIVNVAQVQAMLGISRHLAYALIGDYRQRVCAVCGSTYWPTHSQQKFCSEECKR